MRRHYPTLNLFLGLLLGASLLSCGGRPAPGPASRREADLVRPVGHALAQDLQHRLRAELLGALESGGPAGAIGVCSVRAQQLAQELGAAATPPAELRRVSRRARNPLDAPDEWDLQALDYFEGADRGSGHLPADWVLRLERTGGLRYRYYTPIVTGAPCLSCHGETLSDTVRTVLATLYPQDTATGYCEGELRGLVRVELDAAAFSN